MSELKLIIFYIEKLEVYVCCKEEHYTKYGAKIIENDVCFGLGNDEDEATEDYYFNEANMNSSGDLSNSSDTKH